MAFDFRNKKPIIDYPCRWVYKIIGFDEIDIRLAIADIVGQREHDVVLSNRSTSGKYCCLNLELTVSDEIDRVQIYEALRSHRATQIIL